MVLPKLNPKGAIKITTIPKGGKKLIIYIKESNVYKVIFKSNKLKALKFEEWLTYKVLLSIKNWNIFTNR